MTGATASSISATSPYQQVRAVRLRPALAVIQVGADAATVESTPINELGPIRSPHSTKSTPLQ
jgi:hypothetical protein